MWETPTTPRESHSIQRAVPQRQREYQAGRAAARAALRELGVEGFDLLSGDNREPIWPPGIVGSITHSADHCAVAAGWKSDVRAVGIDVETATSLPAEITGRICSGPERAHTRELGRLDPAVWMKVIFSAKEAFYKAYFPEVGRFLDFLDVDMRLQPDAGTFLVETRPDVPALCGQRSVGGHFAIRDSMIFTAVSLESR